MRRSSSSQDDRKTLDTTRMDRIFSKGTLLVLGIAGIIIFLASMFREYPWTTEIRATVSPREITLGDTLFYKDSTLGTDQVTWEFGNGEISSDKQGAYVFTSPGSYVVSVKSGSKTNFFPVKVHAASKHKKKKAVRIIGPTFALKGEMVTFMGEGESDTWCWGINHYGKYRCPLGSNRYMTTEFDRIGFNKVILITRGKDTAYHTIYIENPWILNICDSPGPCGTPHRIY